MATLTWSVESDGLQDKRKLSIIADWFQQLSNRRVLVKNRMKEPGTPIDFSNVQKFDEEFRAIDVHFKGISLFYTEMGSNTSHSITCAGIEINADTSQVVIENKAVHGLYIQIQCLEPFAFDIPLEDESPVSSDRIFTPILRWSKGVTTPENAKNLDVIAEWLSMLTDKKVTVRNRIKEVGKPLDFTPTNQDQTVILEKPALRGFTFYYKESDNNFDSQIGAACIEVDLDNCMVVFESENTQNLFIRMEAAEVFEFDLPEPETPTQDTIEPMDGQVNNTESMESIDPMEKSNDSSSKPSDEQTDQPKTEFSTQTEFSTMDESELDKKFKALLEEDSK